MRSVLSIVCGLYDVAINALDCCGLRYAQWIFAWCVCFMVSSSIAVAQTEVSDYGRVGQAALGTTLVTDYQSIGVNPANLGFVLEPFYFVESSPAGVGVERVTRRFAMSIGEAGAAIHSNAMPTGALITAVSTFGGTSFSASEKAQAARRFSGNGVFLNADVLLGAASYQTDGYGGFAVAVRERFAAQFILNSFAADFAFLGRKTPYFDSSVVYSWAPLDTVGIARKPRLYSELFDSTRIGFSWTREFCFGYGKRIFSSQNTSVYAGFTVKAIYGFALVTAYVDEDNKLVATSAITPAFNIDYGKSTTPSKIQGTDLIPVGRGTGFDLGVTIQMFEKWKVGLSVLDIGTIYWKGNVYSVSDDTLNYVSSTGFNSYNFFNEAQNIKGSGKTFLYSGLSETTTALPARIRFGLTYSYGLERDAGVDIIVPINTLDPANLTSALISFGANHTIASWVQVQTGFTFGGSMGFNMPAGVKFSLLDNRWEFGISTRDILTIVFGKNPTISLSTALLRIRL